jgi:hypothetical protein
MPYRTRSAARPRQLLRGFVLLLACLAPPAGAAAEPAASPLARLALSLTGAPAPLRADLAQAALIELSDAYAREADQARADQYRDRRGRELSRWAAAIDNLAREYALLAEAVTPYTPVGLRIGPDRVIYMNVAGKPVAVSGPRPREQAALERRILARYCELNLCDTEAFAALADPTAPEHAYAAAADGEALLRSTPHPPGAATYWSFSPAGPVCATDDGLEFQFVSSDDLTHKRAACAAVVAELVRLADALKQQQELGASIDWEAVKIVNTADSGLQRVVYDHSGGELFLSLGTLAGVPELVALTRPWLAARARGDRHHLVILHADRHMGRISVR